MFMLTRVCVCATRINEKASMNLKESKERYTREGFRGREEKEELT